jgi:hypothetical protein
MKRLMIPSLRWPLVLAVALGLTLFGPVSLAEEEAEQETAQAEETQPAAESEVEATPAPELRVEQGRILTNRGGAAQSATPKEKVQIDEGLVITNAVLDRLFGPSPEAPTAPVAEEPVDQAPSSRPADALKVLRDEQATAVQRERMIAEAQAELDAAKAKLANLEVELLATRNPFSKRPELSEEEKEYRRSSGETAAERNERIQKLVDEARVEVQAAEENLAQFRSGS